MLTNLLNWFKSLWIQYDEKPVFPAVEEPDTKGKMRISPEVLARAHKVGASVVVENAFKPATPPPGVIPQGHTAMAMDEAASEVSTWAGEWMFQEGIGFLGYPYLAELGQRPEYRRISEIIATEMTRKWIKLQATGDDDQARSEKIIALEKLMKRYKIQDLFRRAAELDGFFGRAHIFIDLGVSGEPEELKSPVGKIGSSLIKAKVKKGSLKGFKIIEPVWTYPNAYNSSDPLAEDFYKPTSWFVQGKLIHETRMITFVAREVSDMLKPAYSFGGLSLSQMAKPYVDNWLRTRQSVSDLLHSFTVFVLKTDMSATLEGEDSTVMFDRAVLFNRLRDNRGLMMINKDTEEFENVSASLGSLDKLQAQAQEHMSAVSGIPLVKLLGITPSGLNASSDGEMRCFYDWIEAQQKNQFTDHLTRVIELIQLSEWGEIDEAITFQFLPLWTLDASALAAMRKTEIDTDVAMIENGIIDPAESRKRVASDEDSPYATLDMGKEIMPPGEGGLGEEGIDPETGMPHAVGDPEPEPAPMNPNAPAPGEAPEANLQ
jgi:phage-related protein (TIGR01555 family)